MLFCPFFALSSRKLPFGVFGGNTSLDVQDCGQLSGDILGIPPAIAGYASVSKKMSISTLADLLLK